MAQQTINVGAAPNDGTGTPLRTAFQYTNSNFTELYTAVGPSGNNIVCPGTVTVSAGTLALPSLTTAGDTNTGIYFPAADTIGFAEGGVEAMRINSAGNLVVNNAASITGDLTVRTNKLAVTSVGVGFGTTTPAYPAHFRTTSPVIAIQDDTSAATGVGGTMNFLGFTSGTSGANIFAQIKGVKTAGSAGGEYQVFTSDSAGNSVQRYLIDSTGVSTWSVAGSTAMTLNATGLGVGVASPSYKLDVNGTANCNFLRVTSASGTALSLVNTTSALTYTLYSANVAANGFNGFGIFNGTSYDLQIVNGNVGIGVQPSAKFDVGLTGAGTPRIQFTSASDNPIYQTQRYSGVGSNYFGERLITGGGFFFQSAPAAAVGSQTFTTTMSVDSSGRLVLLASTTTPATLTTNGQLTFTATSDTNLRFSYRGSDGVTRVANLTLA